MTNALSRFMTTCFFGKKMLLFYQEALLLFLIFKLSFERKSFMLFHEKLDFLMKITNTNNSSLAKYSALDSSYISRLRRGERQLPKESSFLKPMSCFFARQCTETYQKKALSEAIDISVDKMYDAETTASFIFQWLTQNLNAAGSNSVEKLLSGLSRIAPSSQPSLHSDMFASNRNDCIVFYGEEGKRQAAITFLNLVLQSGKHCDLLLYSDENPEWMINHPSFSKTWTELITKLVADGHKIKIIHKVSRDINEMLYVINQWLPLYITGNVEPYYYPKLRDGVYKRTLYVAPGLATVNSSSIGDITDGNANMLLTDHSVVNSFTDEFYQYLSLCKPLLSIHSGNDALIALCRLQSYQTDFITKSDYFTAITMPAELYTKIRKRLQREESLADIRYFASLSLFEEKLKTNKVTNLFSLPSKEDIINGRVAISASNIIYGETLYYTVEEFKEHLKNILFLLKKYWNYKVFLLPPEERSSNLLCIAENYDVLIQQNQLDTMLEINEPNMLLVFSDYLMDNKNIYSETTREQTIAALEEFLESLEDENMQITIDDI